MEGYLIKKVVARQVFDSRANPTVEVDVILEDGTLGRAIVPSGASKGKFEALELRDGESTLDGKGVRTAVANVNDILGPALVGKDCRRQYELDRMMIAMDGTPNKTKYGANAILGCSMAICWAAANYYKMPLYRYLGGAKANTLPVPMIQILGGGAHANMAIDIQDFLAIPLSADTFEEGYEMVVNVYFEAKKLFQKLGRPLSIADEGGFWPTGYKTNEEGVALLTECIRNAGYVPGVDLAIALDIAASEFYDPEKKKYVLALEDRELSTEEMVDMLCEWAEKYPIISIEDGVSEEDWEGQKLLSKRLGDRIQLIGDDLFTTNLARIKKGWELGCDNAVLIKLNQIGSVTETLEAIEYTTDHGYLPVVSARSGETEDVTIVHLAIATNAGQLKVGSVARSERTVKWNECIRIEQELGDNAKYPSAGLFRESCIRNFGAERKRNG